MILVNFNRTQSLMSQIASLLSVFHEVDRHFHISIGIENSKPPNQIQPILNQHL